MPVEYMSGFFILAYTYDEPFSAIYLSYLDHARLL